MTIEIKAVDARLPPWSAFRPNAVACTIQQPTVHYRCKEGRPAWSWLAGIWGLRGRRARSFEDPWRGHEIGSVGTPGTSSKASRALRLLALGHGPARSLGGRITRADSTSALEKPCTEVGQPFRTNSPSLRQVACQRCRHVAEQKRRASPRVFGGTSPPHQGQAERAVMTGALRLGHRRKGRPGTPRRTRNTVFARRVWRSSRRHGVVPRRRQMGRRTTRRLHRDPSLPANCEQPPPRPAGLSTGGSSGVSAQAVNY